MQASSSKQGRVVALPALVDTRHRGNNAAAAAAAAAAASSNAASAAAQGKRTGAQSAQPLRRVTGVPHAAAERAVASAKTRRTSVGWQGGGKETAATAAAAAAATAAAAAAARPASPLVPQPRPPPAGASASPSRSSPAAWEQQRPRHTTICALTKRVNSVLGDVGSILQACDSAASAAAAATSPTASQQQQPRFARAHSPEPTHSTPPPSYQQATKDKARLRASADAPVTPTTTAAAAATFSSSATAASATASERREKRRKRRGGSKSAESAAAEQQGGAAAAASTTIVTTASAAARQRSVFEADVDAITAQLRTLRQASLFSTAPSGGGGDVRSKSMDTLLSDWKLSSRQVSPSPHRHRRVSAAAAAAAGGGGGGLPLAPSSPPPRIVPAGGASCALAQLLATRHEQQRLLCGVVAAAALAGCAAARQAAESVVDRRVAACEHKAVQQLIRVLRTRLYVEQLAMVAAAAVVATSAVVRDGEQQRSAAAAAASAAAAAVVAAAATGARLGAPSFAAKDAVFSVRLLEGGGGGVDAASAASSSTSPSPSVLSATALPVPASRRHKDTVAGSSAAAAAVSASAPQQHAAVAATAVHPRRVSAAAAAAAAAASTGGGGSGMRRAVSGCGAPKETRASQLRRSSQARSLSAQVTPAPSLAVPQRRTRVRDAAERRRINQAKRAHRLEQWEGAIQGMDIATLKLYVASLNGQFGPEHYSALLRLSMEDCVAKPHASASQIYTLKKRDATEADRALSCSICLDEYEVGIEVASFPRCGHEFHTCCVTAYLQEYSRSCPLCKCSLDLDDADEED